MKPWFLSDNQHAALQSSAAQLCWGASPLAHVVSFLWVQQSPASTFTFMFLRGNRGDRPPEGPEVWQKLWLKSCG